MKRIISSLFLLSTPAFADKPALRLSGPGVRIEPIAIGSVQIIDGELVRLSPMYPYTPQTGQRNRGWGCIWDCFEPDSYDPNGGVPTGFDACPNAGGVPDSRWFFGPAHLNPFISADMSDVAGDTALGVFHSWNWAPAEPEQCTILIFPTTTYAACDTAIPDDGIFGILAGIVFDFGVLPAGAGYYYLAVDFTTTPILSVDLTNANGNVVIHSQTPSFAGPPFTLASASQPMLWGTTEDDENPANDARCGTQDALQYDDDAPTDAVHDLVLECYDYTFADVCPNPLGMSLAWVGKGTNCSSVHPCCTLDKNGDCVIDINELAVFLSVFGTVNGDITFNPTFDSDGDGDIDIADLAFLLACFGFDCN